MESEKYINRYNYDHEDYNVFFQIYFYLAASTKKAMGKECVEAKSMPLTKSKKATNCSVPRSSNMPKSKISLTLPLKMS